MSRVIRFKARVYARSVKTIKNAEGKVIRRYVTLSITIPSRELTYANISKEELLGKIVNVTIEFNADAP